MFSDKKKKRSNLHVDTLIGEGTRLNGDVVFTGGLHVEGRIAGNVVSEEGQRNSLLVISQQGEILGDVQAPNVVISGTVQGSIWVAGCVELMTTAKVTGNIYYNRIEMAMGAEINGQLVHMPEEEFDKPAPALARDNDMPPRLAIEGGAEQDDGATPRFAEESHTITIESSMVDKGERLYDALAESEDKSAASGAATTKLTV
ncbi:MAG TPA: polymer-forming cytoskeletal family protein [Gammaproteobacteria bacterium]|nr:polymer-forming cytoskeletal family protein [Gammaproteobacteria bacterium]